FILSFLPPSLSIPGDLFLFDDPIDLSDGPSHSPPPNPFLPEISSESVDSPSTPSPHPSTVQLKERDSRAIGSSDDVIDVPSLDSLDSYSSPLLSSPDKYSSPDGYSSSIIPSSDKYLSSSGSSFSEPGPIIETGQFRLISSKLLRGASLPPLDGPSMVHQEAYAAYPSSGQSYVTGAAASSSYSLPSSLPIVPSDGYKYASPSQEGSSTASSGVSSYAASPSSGYAQPYTASENYATPYQTGYNNGVYHLNGPIQGRRVVIYKKILRPVRIHRYETIERLPGGKVVDQWAEGGYSSDLLNGRSSVNAPLFTPSNPFYGR
ncbi:hypothetical protein PMAYCL1PPCAC_17871, partial [Pristionchus mayeri]